jgi:hypothetical protein
LGLLFGWEEQLNRLFFKEFLEKLLNYIVHTAGEKVTAAFAYAEAAMQASSHPPRIAI